MNSRKRILFSQAAIKLDGMSKKARETAENSLTNLIEMQRGWYRVVWRATRMGDEAIASLDERQNGVPKGTLYPQRLLYPHTKVGKSLRILPLQET